MVKKNFVDRAGVTEASPVAAKAAVLKDLTIATIGASPEQLTRYMMNIAKNQAGL